MDGFFGGLPGTGPSPCGQEVTKRKGGRHQNSESLGKNRLYELYV